MMFSTGLIGEMIMRTYFESQDRRIYAVREIITRKQRGLAGGRPLRTNDRASLKKSAEPIKTPFLCASDLRITPS